MRVTLKRLEFRNFKGFRSEAFDFDEPITTFFGRNATGKTTLQDGFLWLLFGKDSLGSAAFSIKPLDQEGNSTTNLEHSVKGYFLLDGKESTFERVLTEKWTRPRGKSEQRFDGHVTVYKVNDVPCTQREFQSEIAAIADESLFRLLTDPRFFNSDSACPWQRRREMLLDMCGDVSDSDVIDSMATLTNKDDISNLTNILNLRPLEDHKKILTERRKKINEELKSIPTRIDEAERSITGSVFTSSDAEMLDHWRKVKGEKVAEIHRIENDGEVLEKQKRLAQLEAELAQLDGAESKRAQDYQQAKWDRMAPLRAAAAEIQIGVDVLVKQLPQMEARIAEIEKQLPILRKQWSEEDASQVAVTINTVCPTCKQTLPIEEIEATERRAIEQANLEKSKRLTAITEQGKALAAELETLRGKINEDRLTIEAKQTRRAEIEQQIEAIQNEKQEAQEDPKRQEIMAGIEILKSALSELALGNNDPIHTLQNELLGIEREIQAIEKRQAEAAAAEKTRNRIKELKKQEKALAGELNKNERELFLLEQFTRAKVGMLTERINSRFKITKFKLFNEQINSGLSECCEATLDGVPYGSMNSAGRTQLGLDIISAFQEHHGILLPCWVDNRESVTVLPEMKCQMISLVVSPEHKELTKG